MSFTIFDEKLTNDVPKKDYIRKGISIPFCVNPEGKIKLSEGQQLNEEAITLHLMSTDNDNAFMQQFNFDSIIFKPNSNDIKSPIVNRLKEIFQIFEDQHRMRLIEDKIDVFKAGGFIYITFDYFDIEQNQEKKLGIRGKI